VAQQLPPNPSIQQVAQAIIHLRQTKLPNPEVVGNAGSFFKNPVVTNEKFVQIKSVFLDIVGYKTDDHHTKLSAAWLIEQCAYKGRRTGDAGTYTQHSLVLVNYGRAQGSDILQFATEIQQAVLEKFGVGIVPEVNIW
jgi:UDP-N-acetylmuramate dehydrogenase